MNAAVARLLDDRERQGLSRHVEDQLVLERVAALLAAPNPKVSRQKAG